MIDKDTVQITEQSAVMTVGFPAVAGRSAYSFFVSRMSSAALRPAL